jgi:hypothetical protein
MAPIDKIEHHVCDLLHVLCAQRAHWFGDFQLEIDLLHLHLRRV